MKSISLLQMDCVIRCLGGYDGVIELLRGNKKVAENGKSMVCPVTFDEAREVWFMDLELEGLSGADLLLRMEDVMGYAFDVPARRIILAQQVEVSNRGKTFRLIIVPSQTIGANDPDDSSSFRDWEGKNWSGQTLIDVPVEAVCKARIKLRPEHFQTMQADYLIFMHEKQEYVTDRTVRVLTVTKETSSGMVGKDSLATLTMSNRPSGDYYPEEPIYFYAKGYFLNSGSSAP